MIETYKGYVIKRDPRVPNILRLSVEGDGGMLPIVLRGGYTELRLARLDIDSYLGVNEDLKEKVRARKTTTKTTG